MSTPAQIAPIQQITLKKSDLDDESLTLLNMVLTNHAQALNNVIGIGGPTKFAGGIDLAGNRIQNVGQAKSITDAVSQEFGDTQYGAAALKPLFESLGKQVMQTYRRLSDKNQREKYSSFLNALASTAPASNTSIIHAGSVSAGTVPVTITAGHFQRVDGTQSPYTSRTDTLALPSTFSITSLTRSGNIVTAVTAASGLIVDEGFTISGAGDSSYDGSFVAATIISGTSFTYYQGGSDGSTTGGTLSIGGVYYYVLPYGQVNLGLISGVGSVDTTSGRILSSIDGSSIVAVVVINGSGVEVLNSAAGATPLQAGSNVAIIRRL